MISISALKNHQWLDLYRTEWGSLADEGCFPILTLGQMTKVKPLNFVNGKDSPSELTVMPVHPDLHLLHPSHTFIVSAVSYTHMQS